jgi:uncharacterized membrane protein
MNEQRHIYTDRARRKSREIALAVILTLAAAACLILALQRQPQKTAVLVGISPVVSTQAQ